MMNNFIAIELLPTRAGIGGSFMTTASFKLDNYLCQEYFDALEQNFGIKQN